MERIKMIELRVAKHRAIVLACALLLGACGGSRSDEAGPSVREPQPPTNTTTKSPSDPGTIVEESPVEEAPVVAFRNVTLDAPPQGSTIQSNPFRIAGTARTFENNVAIRIKDASGVLMQETFTTARGDMGNFNPWDAHIFLARDPGGAVVVEALEYSAKDGSETSLVSRRYPIALAMLPVALHFSTGDGTDCSKTLRVVRQLPRSISIARLMMEALVLGPTQAETAAGAGTQFPRGSRIESVALRDGVLTVDLNAELQNVGGSCRVGAIRSMIEKTGREIPGVTSVRITAGGSEKLALQP